jgi:hypothetical protein
MPKLMYGMPFKSYLPLNIKGSMITTPADFLKDAQSPAQAPQKRGICFR